MVSDKTIPSLRNMLTLPTIQAFDAYLAARNLRFEAIIVGGSALALLNVIDRPTRDVDVLAPNLDVATSRAAREFAAEMRASGNALADEWLNNGPSGLVAVLPSGWESRLRPVFDGAFLRLNTLGEADLLKSKLFALCDRGTDLGDCMALAPSADDLASAEVWLAAQDAHPMWPDHVRSTLRDLSRRLKHGL